jgi:hypothetical protein
MNEAIIPTWNLLPSLGFQPDDTIIFSDIRPGLSLNFGNFKLSAVAVTSPFSGEIVLFSGVLATSRTLAEIHFELPRRVESLKQCAAWIVWNLDQHWDGRVFRPARELGWVEEARRNRRLLPWVMSQAEFDARPQCTVQRDWLRLVLKTLAEHVAALPDESIVAFQFDGSIFSIRSEKRLIVVPGEGRPWTVLFRADAKALRPRPKRFMRESISVSLWESRIRFDSWSYGGSVVPAAGENTSAVQ